MSALTIIPISGSGSRTSSRVSDDVTDGRSDGSEDVIPVVPVGWKRELVQGRIVYTTPTQYLLWSQDEVLSYLTTDGTCKCGLSCPLHVDQVFNFDPSFKCPLLSPNDSDLNQKTHILCNHRRKRKSLAQLEFMSEKSSKSEDQNRDQLVQKQQQQIQKEETHDARNVNIEAANLLENHTNCRAVYEDPSHGLVIENQAVDLQNASHTLMSKHHQQQQQHHQSHLLVVNTIPSENDLVATGLVNGHNDTQMQQHHQYQLQHHHQAKQMPDNRQTLHDVTAVTASITELIPSVGQFIPAPVQIQPVPHPAHQQIQYSLILPTQQAILMQQPSDHAHGTQMLLSPHIVSPFSHTSHAVSQQQQFHPHFNQQHQQQYHTSAQYYDGQVNPVDLVTPKVRRRRNNSKKVRTVAAILNLNT